MWYIRLLKTFLGDKVSKRERPELNAVIDSVFKTYIYINPDIKLPEFECVLHILCYMRRMYINPSQSTITEIRDDLQMAIILAEKVTNDDSIWLESFTPEFGSIEKLKQNERRVLSYKLNYRTGIRDTDLLALLTIADPTILAEYKFFSILECLSANKEEFNALSKNSSIVDELLAHPILVNQNESDIHAVTKGLKIINNLTSFYALREIKLAPFFVDNVQMIFSIYKNHLTKQALHTRFFKSTTFFNEQIELSVKIIDLLNDYKTDDLLTADELFNLLGRCVVFDQENRILSDKVNKSAERNFDLILIKCFSSLERYIATRPDFSSKGLSNWTTYLHI